MTAKQLGACLVAGTLLVALVFWRPDIGEPESSPSRPLVQLPPASAPASPARRSVSAELQTLPDPRIAKTLEDPGATFRGVWAADGANKFVCGEVRESGRSYYRRFVWIAEAQLLATDDGGPQFAHVGELCDGGVGSIDPEPR